MKLRREEGGKRGNSIVYQIILSVFSSYLHPFGALNCHPFGALNCHPFGALDSHPFDALNCHPFGALDCHPFDALNCHPFEALKCHPFGALDCHPFGALKCQFFMHLIVHLDSSHLSSLSIINFISLSWMLSQTKFTGLLTVPILQWTRYTIL